MMRFVLALACVLACGTAGAQVARVVSLQGTLALERAGQPARILGTGDGVEQKDVVNVAQASHGVLEFRDKTRVTLRPNTIFRVENYNDGGDASLVLGLQKGGFRAVSGDIAKRGPDAMRVQTSSTILGVRGTEFDARICDNDCGDPAQRPIPAGPPIIARVIELSGNVTASQGKAPPRTLVAGAALHALDIVTAGPGSHAVIVFIDDTRMRLTENSVLSIERYAYDPLKPEASGAHLKLVSGRTHFWTGALSKISPQAFRLETRAGMIEPHGTGGSAGDDGNGNFALYTWNGSVFLETGGRRVEVKQPSALLVGLVDGKVEFLAVPPKALLGGSDLADLKIDPKIFTAPGEPLDGLYVWVRSGLVQMGSLEIKAGTVGFFGRGGPTLLNFVPAMMVLDLTPRAQGPAQPATLRIFKGADGSIGMCIAN